MLEDLEVAVRRSRYPVVSVKIGVVGRREKIMFEVELLKTRIVAISVEVRDYRRTIEDVIGIAVDSDTVN